MTYTSEHDLPRFADPGSSSPYGDPRPRYEVEYDYSPEPELTPEQLAHRQRINVILAGQMHLWIDAGWTGGAA